MFVLKILPYKYLYGFVFQVLSHAAKLLFD